MAFDPTTAVPDESPSQFDPSTAKPVKSSTLRKAGDLGLGFASGALGATRALSDAFGAGNAVSRGLKSAGEGVDSLLTPEAQDAQYRQSQILDEAKGKGFGAQVAAGGRAFMEAPVQTAVQGLGSVVPLLATAVIPGALPARIAAGAMGAGMGVGTAKGAIRDEVEKRELGAGKTPEQAAAAADAAQAYSGPNTDQIALGGALGVADAAFGVAPAAVGMVRRKLGREALEQVAGQAGESIIKAGLKGAAKEMPVEFAQGGQEQVAANVAAQRAGYEAGTFDGAFSQGALEALASAGPGAGFGILNRQRQTPEAPPAIQPNTTPGTPPAAAAPPTAPGTPPNFDPAAPVLDERALYAAGVTPPARLDTGRIDSMVDFSPPPLGQSLTGFDPATGLMDRSDPLRTALPERPSAAMGLDPALGGLTAAAALAVDSGASPAAQGFGIRRRTADFTDVEPITAADGQIETPRRLGDSPVFDVQAREINTDQPSIEATRRLPFNNPGATNGPQTQEAFTSEPRSEEAPAAGVSDVARPTAEQRARNLAALKQRMQAGRAQPQAADAAGSQPVPQAQGQDAGALSAAVAPVGQPPATAPQGGGQTAPPLAPVAAEQDGRQKAARAEMMETRKPAQVAAPTPMKRITIDAATLSGTKKVNAKLYELPGYDGPQLAVAEYKTSRGTGYRVYLPKSGRMIEDSNGVSTLNDTLKVAVQRIRNAWATAPADLSTNPPKIDTSAAPVREAVKNEQVADKPLPPKLSAQLQEAHRALGRDVTRSQVQRMRDGVAREVETGTTNNGGVIGRLTPKALADRRAQLQRLDADLALFDGVQADPKKPGGGIERIKQAAGVASTPATQPAPKADAGPDLLGRNSQPFSEGGKPFKTEADAKAAKKLHPTKRVMKVKGGYALADKTPKQVAADAAKAKRLRQFNSGTPGKPMSAHEFVVSEGGMSAAVRSELGVDGNPRVGNRTLFAGQGKPGLTLEQAAMKLKQAGYIADESESAAADIIKRSLTNPQYTPEGFEAVAEAEREAEFQDYLNAAQEPVDENADDFDPFGPSPDFSPAELADAGYDEATAKIKAEVDALIAMAEAQGIDTETLREDAARATADQTEQEYYEQARRAINDALSQSAASRRSDSAGRVGQGQQGEAQRGSGEDRIAPAGEQGGEGLTAPTRADIEAQQARAEQAANSKAAKDKADAAREAKERERADVKRLSEAAADTFVLGGDAMANLTGQTDIFGNAPEVEPASAPQADDLDAMFDDLMDEVAPAPAAPKATELTPKQFHEAKLAYIAADTGASMAEVRENYDTDGGRAEHQREWLIDVEQAAKNGDALTRKTLDKLYEIAPNARLPEAAFPQGYQRPEARKAEAAEKQVRKAAPRTAGQAAASAAKNTASALNNAIDGLGALFGANSKGRLGSGLSFDENTYQQAKPLFVQAIANLKDAGSDIREAMRAVIKMVVDKFGADTATAMKPYIVRFTSDVRDGTITQEDINAASADTNLERDSRQPAAEPAVGDPVPGDTRGSASDAGQDDAQGDGQPGLTRIQADGTPADRKRGDQRVSDRVGQAGIEEFDAGADIGEPSGATGDTGIPPEPIPASAVVSAAEGGIAKQRALYQQRQAESVAVKAGDLANIKATLPYLLEGQQEDVLKAETRFAKEDGYGMLFTNGTGTGKTFSGLGVVKRFARQGKTNTLIVVPDDKIASDWVESAKALGLNVNRLKDTKDAGDGVVITTYANLGENDALATRQWGLVVADEAHTLMQSADGKVTGYLENLRAITYHPDGAYQRALMLHGDILAAASMAQKDADLAAKSDDQRDWPKAQVHQDRANKLNAEFDAKLKAIRQEVADNQGAKRTRAVFLSATPFAYEKTVDWANGYLFDYNEGREAEGARSRRYNEGSNREQFFMQNFGYTMRYGKLTAPDARLVDSGLMQRQFNSTLKKAGSLSGRVLDVKADYDRRFVLVESAVGNQIDEAIGWIEANRKAHYETHKDKKGKDTPPNGYDFLQTQLNDTLYGKLGHLLRRYLLEAIKAKEVIPIIRQHMAMGRKVVVFHDFNKGGAVNPFKFMPRPEPEGMDAADPEKADMLAKVRAYNEAVAAFDAKFPRLSSGLDLADLASPIERFKREFKDVLLINGNEKKADLLQRYKTFNDDATGPVVALVQSDKNKGWSGHDTTGKYPRVLFNLGLPTQPTKSIQQEGRIYRTGQVSNAMFRYLNTGTNWERWAFAQTIADRASAAENLGMGELSRALKDSFISAFEESDTYAPGHEGEGTGGKERDKASNNAMSEWDRAKAFYWGTQKKNSKTKAQEGADYFATPEPVGLKMVQWLGLRAGDATLEPSGGHGAIARWLPDTGKRTVIEPSSALRSRLAMVMNPAEDRILDGQFEDLDVVNKFDGIAMNPPFGTAGRTAIDHVAKAATHLRDGGRIVALIPTGPAADKKFDKWFYEEQTKPAKPLFTDDALGAIYEGDTLTAGEALNGLKLIVGHVDKHSDGRVTARPKGESVKSGVLLKYIKSVKPGDRTETFKPAKDLYMVADIKLPQVTFERAGTSVATRVVVIEKQTDSARAPSQAKSIDLTDITDINKLFDRIENIDLPVRAMSKAQEEAAKAEEAAPRKTERTKPAKAEAQPTVERNGAELVEHTTKAGKVIKGIIRKDLTKAQAEKIDPYTWKKDGGFFIREKYLKPEADATAFSRGTTAQGIPLSTVKQITDAIRARWANAPEIVVAASMQDAAIPERVRQEDAKQRSQGASGEPEGFYYGGKVYLVASALNKPADVVRVLFHESLGHAGLRGVFGESLTPILKQLAVLRRADVAAKASEYGLNMSIEAERLQAAEEVLAVMAETKPELGYVQRAIAAIRAFMRKHIPGFGKMMLTDAEIINSFILPARRFVERGPGGGPRGGMPAPAFSRTDNGTMTEDQAIKAGFTLKAYRGVSKESPFNDSGTTWLTTSREVAEAYAEEVMGYDDPGVLEVMVKPDGLQRFDASRLTDEQREELGADDFGNPQAMGIYDRSDDHPLGGSRRNVTVIHAPREAVAVLAGQDDIRFSRSNAGTAGVADLSNDTWTPPMPSKWDDYVFQLQDKNIDLKRVTQAITEWSGKLADNINVYLQEELYHGRTAKRVQEFSRLELEPALRQLAADGYQLSDLEEYLHARHAKEANRVIAERNPTQAMIDAARAKAKAEVERLELALEAAPAGMRKALKDQLKKAKDERKRWRGAAAFKGTEAERLMLSGMSDAAADAYFAQLPQADKDKLGAVAAQFDKIMDETSRLMVEYELESQDTVDSWAKMYQHYIPLQREDKDGGSRGTGQGFSIKGRETKGRTGSTRKVVDIVANIANAREKAVVRGEKNRVAQALVGMVAANPNKDFWKVGPPEYERVFNPATGKVENRINPAYKSLPNVVIAKVAKDGAVKEVAVTFNEDDERAVRMAGALKNLDTPQIEGWLGNVSKITRYFASISTQYNPIFGVVNLVRDIQGAAINLAATPLADKKMEVSKDAVRALAGIYQDIRATRKGGVASSKWSKLYEQFQHDGGQTGFRNMFETSADRTADLTDKIDPEAWAKSDMGKFFSANGQLVKPMNQIRKGTSVIFDWLSDYNEAMENGVRLAAYKAALDKGMSRQQAASLAKNLTVNFNRKGLAGNQAGAVYAFFNAAMQGTARIGQALTTMDPGKPSTIRLSPLGKKIVYGGMLLGSMQALALAGAGFGDDEPPDFVREKNLVIPTGGKTYIGIPMPLGLHVIPSIGRIATEFALDGFESPVQRATQVAGLFADAFNPIGNAGMSMQTLAPTVLDPFVALTENKDYTGKPIARVAFNKDLPGFSQHKDSASIISKFLAEAINTLSGGNEYVAGVFSPTPDQIDYLAGQLGGGVWRELSKLEQTATGTVTGEDTPIYKVPLVGRFVGSAAGQAGEGNKFYSNANKLNRLETEIKGLMKDGKTAEAAALRAENPEARLIVRFNMVERQVQKLRKQKSELIKSGDQSHQVRVIEQRITDLMANMNRVIGEIEASQ